MFSLPRNMMNAPFPPAARCTTSTRTASRARATRGNWMLNAVYHQVPVLHPGVLGKSDNEGADAVKQAGRGQPRAPGRLLPAGQPRRASSRSSTRWVASPSTSTSPSPIGGNTDLGIPPEDYLEPGPDQRLDGFQALWFARGRYGSDDYQRMERQRCMVDAIIDEADPLTLLRRYQALAAAGKEIIRTDIPRELLPAFVDLASRTKETRPRSVVFRSSDEFIPADPDFDYVQATVAKALEPKKRPAGPGRSRRRRSTPAPTT